MVILNTINPIFILGFYKGNSERLKLEILFFIHLVLNIFLKLRQKSMGPYDARACQYFENLNLEKNNSDQMIDFCITNSTPPSVFKLLVGKLHFFCLKDPVAKGGSKKYCHKL